MIQDVVILGAGQAGLQVASSLRESGFGGRIRLLGDEPYPPYQRPPLSKTFLSGAAAEDALFMQEESCFADQGIDFFAGARAVAIDRANSRVDLASGPPVPYGHLVLATGARNRQLPCVEGAMAGVVSIRTLDDSRRLKRALAGARRVVVVGAGFLGLEVATVAIAAGCAVDVLEAGPTALGRVVSAPMSRAFQRRHAAAGVRFRFADSVVAIHAGHGTASGVELGGGTRIAADLILIAIGVVPNAELAAAAGLAVHDGIVVDEFLLTEDPAISAIGDCACFPYAADAGRMVRLESVQNAVDQARCVAQRLTGHAARYDQVPLFWSDQAGARLQIAGIAQPGDAAVTRGDPDGAGFSVFRYHGDRLVAVESVNRLPDHMQARRLLKARVSPAPEEAANPAFDLKSLLAGPVGTA